MVANVNKAPKLVKATRNNAKSREGGHILCNKKSNAENKIIQGSSRENSVELTVQNTRSSSKAQDSSSASAGRACDGKTHVQPASHANETAYE